MKKNKLVLIFAITAILASGCGNNTNNNNSQTDSAAINITTVPETTVSDEDTEKQETTTVTEATTEETAEVTESQDDIKKEAALKIKGFNKIHAIMTGVGADEAGIQCDRNIDYSTLIGKDGNLLKPGCYKLLDEELKSKDDMRKLIDDTFSDFEYTYFDEIFAETEDALYVYSDILITHNGNNAYLFFNTNESEWEYSDITDDSFSVTAEKCKGRHDFDFTVKIVFTKTDDGWKIKEFI